jgi:hypothetical protein
MKIYASFITLEMGARREACTGGLIAGKERWASHTRRATDLEPIRRAWLQLHEGLVNLSHL